jgi:hypothetical protein
MLSFCRQTMSFCRRKLKNSAFLPQNGAPGIGEKSAKKRVFLT